MDIVYQPIFDLHNGCIFGYEALLRPAHGSPLEAIETARREKRIVALDRWIMFQASVQAATWLERDQLLFLNAEPVTVTDPSTWEPWPLALPPERVVIELTERDVLVGLDISPLKAQGVRLALDDFGTGHSNVEALSWIRPQFVKLDRQFWTQCGEVKALTQTVKRPDFCLLAEGVETAEDLEFVRRLPVRYVQGFYLGRPMPADNLRREASPVRLGVL
ncbi:EAL domain-containing protein [Alicyclobacillus macrosporangiidus]|uniref:EAL domain, c-di-GMP-specific phosphodiesterase class I (Or its enzymatically inactive variant) n=1 Tax=Alicyclobacillus macrosporangiidus TaxID=392015 RepID=A0A1I7KDL0_9BACL|nr:EAL domain-containing protein [Alicyclobacillus macrosporangiidus]SFU95495.1 EAL domain, c-di-GMP-specific phosphodiesterase class I (or its enzymatically inactive variant) [Alicyclobacillus macrosporangiidus]